MLQCGGHGGAVSSLRYWCSLVSPRATCHCNCVLPSEKLGCPALLDLFLKLGNLFIRSFSHYCMLHACHYPCHPSFQKLSTFNSGKAANQMNCQICQLYLTRVGHENSRRYWTSSLGTWVSVFVQTTESEIKLWSHVLPRRLRRVVTQHINENWNLKPFIVDTVGGMEEKRGDECTPAKLAPVSGRTRTKPWDCKLKLSCVHAGWKKVVAKNYSRLGSFVAISAAGLHTPLPCVILSFMLFRFILILSFLPWLNRLFFHV